MSNATTEADRTDRMVIRFDPATQIVYKGNAKRKTRNGILRGASVIEYVERIGARTPTGGVFTSRRMTITYQGSRWYGQCRKDSDRVTLRLAK